MPASRTNRPDQGKIRHLMNGMRNNKVDQSSAVAQIDKEWRLAFAHMVSQDHQIELLSRELEALKEDLAAANAKLDRARKADDNPLDSD